MPVEHPPPARDEGGTARDISGPATGRVAPALPADPELATLLQHALAGPVARIRPLVLADGRRFWLKQVEPPSSLYLRLTKGDPGAAFAREQAAIRFLVRRGAPVPRPVAEGADYLLLPDAGPTLMTLGRDPEQDEAGLRVAIIATGRMLAAFHRQGLVHGRPALRDLCWDGRAVRMIDFENFRPGAHGTGRQARDLLVLIHSAFARWERMPERVEALLAAYAGGAPRAVLVRARRMARGLSLVLPLVRLALVFRPHSRELRAVPLALGRLAGMLIPDGAEPAPAAPEAAPHRREDRR